MYAATDWVSSGKLIGMSGLSTPPALRALLTTRREAFPARATKTKIMYKAYLSYAQLKEYLSVLAENGLISYDPEESGYKTTENGVRFLGIYDQMTGLTGEVKVV